MISCNINLKQAEKAALERYLETKTLPLEKSIRALIILFANEGKTIKGTARELEIQPRDVRRWRKCWIKSDHTQIVSRRLENRGRKPCLTRAQKQQLTDLIKSSRPLKSFNSIAEMAVECGITKSISAETVRNIARSEMKIQGSAYAHFYQKGRE